jgi:phospholipid/cholesterol/gamma-HCH transport system permease protein
MLPAVIVFSLIKESGPVITALIVSGRAGAGLGAELGSMRVTEQDPCASPSRLTQWKSLP